MKVSARIARTASAWAITIFVHAIVWYLLLNGLRPNKTADSTARGGELMFINTDSTKSAAKRPRAGAHRRQAAVDTNRIATAVTEEPGSDPIDWSSAITEAIGNTMEAQEPTRFRSLDSSPKVSELPKKANNTRHQNGDTERFDDGEIITWINKDCYVTNHPDSGPFGHPNAVNTVCKGNVGKQKAADDRFDSLRPNYLGGPKTIDGERRRRETAECFPECGH